jgi:hypothetical protein
MTAAHLHARELRRVGFDYTVPSQRVEYEVRENRNRPGHFMAINIRLLDPVLSKPIVAPAHGDDEHKRLAAAAFMRSPAA